MVVVVQPRVGNGRSGGVPYLLPETFEEIEKEKKTKWEMWSFLFGSWDGEPHFSVNETLKCSQKTWLVFITPCSFGRRYHFYKSGRGVCEMRRRGAVMRRWWFGTDSRCRV